VLDALTTVDTFKNLAFFIVAVWWKQNGDRLANQLLGRIAE
jgi:hypothetical protein